ncbi:MAG: DUF47 family protein [Anaerovibrio sp.]|uniref:DUF47 family protein n=1 Tax=Anaerovibrio slackiae TaxID=2652309 RepID=A0A6I2UH20_9FIRM|nr:MULTISPECIES: DUF47 family protein [Anaerovibrio]MBQ2410301.1 DUF47 family protein [Selenomonadaceae bacterium]MBQ5822676.1 DUF47 family protein [Selenomonadaceae bacterium]MBR0328534.1 DUF47 family protein [Selenomonadaceae bacterium]MCI6098347.1 DUF47 family protein [Selenomonadaceae bacterium]MCI6484355.1 DUF47 family protein [Selenomonadaceae bacterium]
MFDLKPKKKSNEFFVLFEESAEYFYQATLLLDEVMMDHRKADIKVKEINDLEHRADKVNDAIIDKLNQTFITPIDREDIYAIANGLDDGVDQLQGMLQRIVIYHTGEAREGALRLTKLLIESTAEIKRAAALLNAISKNQNEILAITSKIDKLESEGDHVFRGELAYLFEYVKDPIELIKWKDLLEGLEDTLDHCERMADLLKGVVMKYA